MIAGRLRAVVLSVGMMGTLHRGEAQPRLEADLLLGFGSRVSATNSYRPLGGGFSFEVLSESPGLWWTDGVPGTTRLLVGSRDELRFLGGDSRLALYNVDGELWRTDGTSGGTFRLLGDESVQLRPVDSVLGGRHLVGTQRGIYLVNRAATEVSLVFSGRGFALGLEVNGRALFIVDPADDEFRWQLWATDGTPEGNERLTGGALRDIQQLGQRLLFSRDNRDSFVLWALDLATGEEEVLYDDGRNFAVGSGRGFPELSSGVVFFNVEQDLWRTDGTVDGTFGVRVDDHPLRGALTTGNVLSTGERLLILGRRAGDSRSSLFSVDRGGRAELLVEGSDLSSPELIALGSHVVLNAGSSNGPVSLEFDPLGRPLGAVTPPIRHFAVRRDAIDYASALVSGLWRVSPGRGTEQLWSRNLDYRALGQSARRGDRLALPLALDAQVRREPAIVDLATSPPTAFNVADLESSISGSAPDRLFEFQGDLYFVASANQDEPELAGGRAGIFRARPGQPIERVLEDELPDCRFLSFAEFYVSADRLFVTCAGISLFDGDLSRLAHWARPFGGSDDRTAVTPDGLLLAVDDFYDRRLLFYPNGSAEEPEVLSSTSLEFAVVEQGILYVRPSVEEPNHRAVVLRAHGGGSEVELVSHPELTSNLEYGAVAGRTRFWFTYSADEFTTVVSDGTAVGTTVLDLPDVDPNSSSGTLQIFSSVGDEPLLSLFAGPNRGIYRFVGDTPVRISTNGEFPYAAVPSRSRASERRIFVLRADDFEILDGWDVLAVDSGGPAQLLARFQSRSDPARPVLWHERVFAALPVNQIGGEIFGEPPGQGLGLLADLSVGGGSSDPNELTVVGDRLYFSADDGVHGRELWSVPLDEQQCVPAPSTLCVGDGRFAVRLAFRDGAFDLHQAQAVSLSNDTGAFWFFDEENLEVIVKTLDGTGINGYHWVFLGALTDLRFEMTVTDVQTGQARRYQNLRGRQPSWGDTQALEDVWDPFGASSGSLPDSSFGIVGERTLHALTAPSESGPCGGGPAIACLNEGRFEVQVEWRDFTSNQGGGRVLPVTDDSAAFWFFEESNLELMIKVVDGTALNDSFWVFAGALSNVGYDIHVRDTVRGVTRTYSNPLGQFGSLSDIEAFPE